MKKVIFITLCLLGLIRMTTTACPPENGNQQDIPLSALQAKLAGTYVPIFSEQGINAPKWDQLWISETAKYTGIEHAPAVVEKLKNSMAGTVIGQEAIAKFGDHPNSDMDFSGPYQFDCGFKQGVAKLIISGRNIKGLDGQGNVLFSHNYSEYDYDKNLDTHKFKSDDGNKDEFTYFFFRPDTPEETCHLEFRYGSDPKALTGLRTGRYAYWMAAAVREGNDADCDGAIRLFVKENLSGGKE